MRHFVPSSPHFFRPVKRALVAGLACLAVLAALCPAPLEIAADSAHPPNPAKSAWFLLWLQELVSYDTLAIYAALALATLLIALPWLPLDRVEHAGWFQRAHRAVCVCVLLAFLGLVALTAVGLFLRGPDWRLVIPF